MVIGGIQDPNKSNNMQILFYKQEKKAGVAAADYKIHVEA
jgi:hypothetical protein